MTFPIQLEITNGQIRASVNGTTNLSVTAPTLYDAVARLQTAVAAANGAPTPAESPDALEKIRRVAGDMKDDPLFDAWQDAIAENRRRENEAEGIFLEQHYPTRL